MINTNEVKEQFELGLENVHHHFKQMELWCRNLAEENQFLWGALVEWGDAALWEKLFGALVEEESNPKILKWIGDLLSLNKYSLATIGFNQLLHNPYTVEPSESIQISLTSILDQILSIDNPDPDEMDRLYINILTWLREAADSNLRAVISEYLQQHHDKLRQSIVDTNSPEVILAYLLTLLAYDLYYPLRDIMEYLLEKEWPFLDTKLNAEQFSQFLWITFYLSLDDVLLEASKECSHYLDQTQNPSISLYKKYCETKNNEYDSVKIDEFAQLMSDVKSFNDKEKAKLWDELEKFLKRRRATLATVDIPLDHPKASVIWQIKNKTNLCPHCSQSKLVKQNFVVDGFLKNSDQARKQVIFELDSCIQCHRVYIYGSMNQALNRVLNPYHGNVNLDPVDYPPDRNKLPLKQPVMKSIPLKPIAAAPVNGIFTWPSTEAKESDGYSDREGNFREETDLHRLGYRITGLNRLQRWDVLVRKAIPSMQLKEIVHTIARNVRLRKSQVGGKTKFQYAIAEWEHDLTRLKQQYYKSNFIWPQY